MRKFYFFIASIILLSGCAKNETIDTAFSFSDNGQKVSGNNYSAVYHHDSLSGVWALTAKFYVGSSAGNNYVQLNISSVNFVVPGTYTFGNPYPNNTAGSLSLNSDSSKFDEVAGNFQVSAIDTVNRKISGGFMFNAVDIHNAAQTVSITGGTFKNLSYEVH